MKVRPVVTLFTKDGCTLCDVVRAVIAHSPRPIRLVEVDIAAPSNALWFQRYQNDIPVLHLNGQFLAKHRLPPVGSE